MADTIDNAMPWLGEDDKKNRAKTSTTTSGGSRATPWLAIGANLNPGEALVIKGRLESEGIPVVVQQEAIGMVMGLTVGPLGSAKVLVPKPLAEKAQAILAETFEVDEAEIDAGEFDDDEL